MGQRGPARKPVALSVLQGDKRSKERARTMITAPDEGRPELPTLVGADVELRSIWDFYVDKLSKMGVVSTTDTDALLVFCETVQQYRHLVVQCRNEPATVTGSQGGQMLNPIYRLKSQVAATMRQYAREFGFTPSARAGISNPKAGSSGDDPNDF